MSGSIPGRTNSSRAEAGSGRWPFWSLSLVLHAVVLGTLIFVSPVREIIFTRKLMAEPEVITRGDELQEVIEEIRDRTAEKLRARLALLEEGQDRMATNFGTLNRHFQPFAEQQRATARSRMQKYMDEAGQRQSELVDLLGEAQKTRDPRKALTAAHLGMSRILTAQEEIRRGIRLLALGDEELLTKQKKAEEGQYNANQFLRWLDGDLVGISRYGKQVASLEKTEAAEQDGLAPLVEAIKKAKALAGGVDQERRALEAEVQEHQEAGDRKKEQEAKKRLDERKRAWQAASREVSEAEKALKRAQDQLDRTRSALKKARERVKKCQESRDGHARVALNVQRSSYYQQKDVIETIVRLLGQPSEEPEEEPGEQE